MLSTLEIESFFDSLKNSSHQYTIKYYSFGKTKFRFIPASEIPDRLIQDCRIFLSVLLNRERHSGLKNCFINLSKKEVNLLIGDKRRLAAIHFLSNAGIIEVNGIFKFGNNNTGSVGTFCKSYLLKEYYNTGSVDRIDLLIESKGKEPVPHNAPRSPILVDTVPLSSVATLPVSLNSKTCKTTGRIHTSVNHLPKIERALLTDANNQQLVDVDFSSSHLQHLVSLVSNDLNSGQYLLTSGIDAFRTELFEFKDQILNHDFYNTIASELNCSREQAKLNTMYWLTGSYQKRKLVQYLKSKYPFISDYIDYNNGNNSTGTKTLYGKKLNRRNGCVIKLMKSEALLVNSIYEEMVKEYNPILHTIFDGFLVEKKYLQQLLNKIKMKSIELLGFEPKLKTSSIDESTKQLFANLSTRIDFKESQAPVEELYSALTDEELKEIEDEYFNI